MEPPPPDTETNDHRDTDTDDQDTDHDTDDWDLYPHVLRLLADGVALRVPTAEELRESHQQCERERAAGDPPTPTPPGPPPTGQEPPEENLLVDLYPQAWRPSMGQRSGPLDRDHPPRPKIDIDSRGHQQHQQPQPQPPLDAVIEYDLYPLVYREYVDERGRVGISAESKRAILRMLQEREERERKELKELKEQLEHEQLEPEKEQETNTHREDKTV